MKVYKNNYYANELHSEHCYIIDDDNYCQTMELSLDDLKELKKQITELLDDNL